MKKIFLMISAFFISIPLLSPYTVNATEDSVIPDYMAPNTIIEYENEYEYKILEGGEYTGPKIYPSVAIQKLKASKNIPEEKIISLKKPKPTKGTKVYYNDDGSLKDIQLGNTGVSTYANKCPNCGAEYLPRGTVLEPNQWFQWGGQYANDNFFQVDSKGKILAYGRFTNFTDKTGETGNVLVKGDVATGYHIDNPVHGKKLVCEANGYKKTMIKRDVGCLPNAILDIWKTGVEYFGKKWSTNVSIYNASYTY